MIIKKVIEDLGHGMLLLEDNRLYIVAWNEIHDKVILDYDAGKMFKVIEVIQDDETDDVLEVHMEIIK